jgi:hypothetical protein
VDGDSTQRNSEARSKREPLDQEISLDGRMKSARGHSTLLDDDPDRDVDARRARTNQESDRERMSDSEEEEMDYSKAATFSDSETEDQSNKSSGGVGEDREIPPLIGRKCGTNTHFPRYIPATRTPQLMKSEASATTKAADNQLARV